MATGSKHTTAETITTHQAKCPAPPVMWCNTICLIDAYVQAKFGLWTTLCRQYLAAFNKGAHWTDPVISGRPECILFVWAKTIALQNAVTTEGCAGQAMTT